MTDAGADQDPILREIVARLIAELRPCRIYLFGSRARVDSGAESDYDLLLLVERPGEPLYRLSQRAYRVLRGIPLRWTCWCGTGRSSTPGSTSPRRSLRPSSARGGCSMQLDPAKVAECRRRGCGGTRHRAASV